MIALAVGIIFMAFAVYAVLPVSWSLQWWPSVVEFLKGGLPLLAFFVGLLALFIGIADIKDRNEARREEEKEKEDEKKSQE